MSSPGITKIGAKMLIPYILLLALYVQFHGDYGPGGGFQAGVIFAAAFILYALVYGLDATVRVMPKAIVERLVGLGVLIYAGVGVISMLAGGNFLEYEVLTWGDHGGGHGGGHGEALEHTVGLTSGDHGTGDAAIGLDHGGEHDAGNSHDAGNGHGDVHDGEHGGGEHGGGHHGVLPQGQHLGLFLIEFGVGVTVFAVMLTIFYSFAGRGRS